MKTFSSICAVTVLALMSISSHADEATDRKEFDAHCAKCHGKTGTGTFMLGRRLGQDKAMLEHRTDLVPEFIRRVVRTGIVSMPAITRVEVTDEQLEAIVRHLTRPRAPEHTANQRHQGNQT